MVTLNKEYLSSLDSIREHFGKEGIISLQDFFEEYPEFTDPERVYQPADYRYEKGNVELDQLSIDFLENITNMKFVDIGVFGFSHRDFDLRKFFEKEGVFFVANVSQKEFEEVGGDIFIIKDDESLQLPRSINTATLIKVSTEDESFVSYVNHYIKDEEIVYLMGFLC